MTHVQTAPYATKPIRPSSALRDLVTLLVITVMVLILSYFFDVFVLIVNFVRKHPGMIVYIDEVVMGFLTLSIGLAVFAWRRWLELRNSTSERIEAQEELLRLTATQAEVERIISKQLRSDMERMKDDVHEIRLLLIGKPRNKFSS